MASYGDYLALALDVMPFTDLGSDVYLLIQVWPKTELLAPTDVEGCRDQSLW